MFNSRHPTFETEAPDQDILSPGEPSAPQDFRIEALEIWAPGRRSPGPCTFLLRCPDKWHGSAHVEHFAGLLVI